MSTVDPTSHHKRNSASQEGHREEQHHEEGHHAQHNENQAAAQNEQNRRTGPTLLDENEVLPKKKKMTKAEKREKRRQEEMEFKKLEMRDHLRRELELSKNSALRGQMDWSRLCKDIKIEEIRIELKQWHNKTIRLLEQKDAVISSMLRDIDTTQESHRRAQIKSRERLQYMADTYKAIVNCIKRLYESQASKMLQEFQEELLTRNTEQTRVQSNCENIMHATNLLIEKRMLDDYKVYIERYEECFNDEIHRRYLLEKATKVKLFALHNQLKDFIYAIKNSSLDPKKYERYRMLMERQVGYVSAFAKLTDAQFLKSRYLSDLQRDLLHQEVESQRKLNDRRLEKAYFLQMRRGIEISMEQESGMMKEKMLIVTGESYHIGKKLRKLVKYGELLLTLLLNCRKFETESEKVISGGAYIVPLPKEDEEQTAVEAANFKLNVLDLAAHVDVSDRELRKEMLLMKAFWRRVAVVEAQNLMLQQEKEQLTAENQKYINFIKYMNTTDNVDELSESLTVELVTPSKESPCPNYMLGKLRSKPKTHD